MPTENRSSNTEMVIVPRELLERLDLGKNTATALGALPELRAALAQPAPQPHAEPIAWMVGTAIWWTKEEAERDAAATGLPIVGLGPMPALQGEPAWFMTEGGVSAMHAKAKAISDQQGLDTSSYSVPLYTHADPGEVERLRGEVRRLHEAGEFLDNVSQGIEDKLHAQLAEAQALLREADEFMYIMTAHDGHAKLAHRYGKDWWDAIDKLRGKVCTALSASAEPSAPGKQGSSIRAVRAPEIQDLLDRAATAIGQYGDSLLGRGKREDSIDLLDLEREVRDLEQEFKGAFGQPCTQENICTSKL